MSELNEKGVSNNRFFRKISNGLDKIIPGFKDSRTRAVMHGIYHDIVANKKEKIGNHEGAEAERRRAQEQYDKARKRSPRIYSPRKYSPWRYSPVSDSY